MNFVNNIKTSFRNAHTRIHTSLNKLLIGLQITAMNARKKLCENNGQFVMDHTVVFVVSLALGGIALVILVNYLKGTLSTQIQKKVSDTLNFS